MKNTVMHRTLNLPGIFFWLGVMFLPSQLLADTDMFGEWYGVVTEAPDASGRHARYEVSLSLLPGNYRIDYPDLDCGGMLRLLESNEQHLRFRDELNYGLENCVKGGRSELRIIGPDLGVYRWFDANGVLKVEGYLNRRRVLVVMAPMAMPL